MRKIISIALIMLPLINLAQERISNKYSNGQTASEGVLVQGKENGIWTYYDSLGTKTQTIEFRNGAVHGKLTYYFSNGKIQNEGEFRYGKMHGHYIENYLNGKPKIEGYYYNGNKDSIWTYYNGSGLKYREEQHFRGDSMLLLNFWVDGKEQTINGFRAYITLPTDSQVKALKIQADDSPTVGIGKLIVKKTNYSQTIYSIQGYRVQNAQRGLFVIDGKKCIVK